MYILASSTHPWRFLKDLKRYFKSYDDFLKHLLEMTKVNNLNFPEKFSEDKVLERYFDEFEKVLSEINFY